MESGSKTSTPVATPVNAKMKKFKGHLTEKSGQRSNQSTPAQSPMLTPLAHRFRCESPSPFIQSIPISHILSDCVIFCDVWSHDGTDNSSSLYARILDRMGATVTTKFTKFDPITHMVFKSGHKSYAEKAVKRGIKIVSCIWVERCRVTQSKVDETNFLIDVSNYKPPKKFKEQQPVYPEEEEEWLRKKEKRKKQREERLYAKRVQFLSPLLAGSTKRGNVDWEKILLAPDTPYVPVSPVFVHPNFIAETPDANIAKKIQRMKEGKPIFSPPSSPCSSSHSQSQIILDVAEDHDETTLSRRTEAVSMDLTAVSPTKCLSFSENEENPNNDPRPDPAVPTATISGSQKSDMDLTCINHGAQIVNRNSSVRSSLDHDQSSSIRLRLSGCSSALDQSESSIRLRLSGSSLQHESSSTTSSFNLRLDDSDKRQSTDVIASSQDSDVTVDDVVAEEEQQPVVVARADISAETKTNASKNKPRRRMLCDEDVLKPASFLLSPSQHKTPRRSNRRSSIHASVAIIAASSGRKRRKSVVRQIDLEAPSDGDSSVSSSVLPPVGAQAAKTLPAGSRYFDPIVEPPTSASSEDEQQTSSRARSKSLSTSYDEKENRSNVAKKNVRRSVKKRTRESTTSSSSSTGENVTSSANNNNKVTSQQRRSRPASKKRVQPLSNLTNEVRPRRSTDEFTTAMLPKAKSRAKREVIVLTSLHREERALAESAIKRLGRFRVHQSVKDERTSHVVCGAARRTVNVLRAISRGLWLVSKQWIFDSAEAGHWLDEVEYEVVGYFPVARETRLQRECATKGAATWTIPLFAQLEGRVFVAHETKPAKAELRELVTLCGGQVTNSPRRAAIRVGQLSTSLHEFDSVKETWILDSISENCIQPREDYLIT